MIHNWECDRCTHQWQSCCFGDFTSSKEEKERNHRQLVSGLCWDCFEQLEKEEIKGLELFELYFYLEEKSRHYGASKTWRTFNEGTPESPFYNHQKYSGMCQDYIKATYNEDGSEKTPSNFEWGQTAENRQLEKIAGEIREIYKNVILTQRTPKRIELDEFQKTAGFVFFGSQPRPEGFVGDPPGKARFTVLFGLDPASGDIVAPKIVMEGENG